MHTLPARLGALFDSTSPGPLQSCHSSSSHVPAPPRRLPAQTSLHAALPRIGIVAAPDESLATSAARLSQQQQQQQSQPQQPAAYYAPPTRVQVRRTRLGQWPQQQQQQQQDAFTQQPTQLLQKQLTDVQLATQAQQQQLWQAQQGPGQQYQGRQQAWPGQSQQAGNNNQQASSSKHHTSAADLQQPQQQWQGARAYQPDQQGPSDTPHAPQWQQRPAQHQQHIHQQQQYQQRQGQGQGYQPRPQQQPQQQSGSRWGPQGGSGWQPDWNQQQQQPGRQQQQQQRHHQQQQQQQQQHSKRPDQQRLSHPELSDGAPASAAASDSSSSSGSQQLRFSYGLKQDWSLPTGMAVTYLGSSSGAPTKDRNVSCTMLRLPESLYLVDCGEGSSRQAKLTGLPLEQVEALFITHLHGDHCFGIGTMLVAMCKARKAAAAANSGSTTSSSSSSSDDGGQLPGPDSPGALRVVGPPRVGEVVSAMLYIAGVGRQLDQPVYITEFVDSGNEAHDWQPLPVPAAAASAVSSSSSSGTPHCQAFIRRMAPTQELPEHEWPAGLARRLDRTGLRWQDSNTRRATFRATPGLLWQIPCSQVTVTAAQLQHRVPCWGYVFEEKLPTAAAAAGSSSSSGGSGVRGRRVVLLGDTVDSRPIAPVALGADLVSHEATFAAGMEGKAAVAQHSTAWMAGQFAWAIQAKALVLTHFSARYEGSRERSKWLPAGAEGSRRGGGGGYDAAAADAMEEERTIKALQREADDQYGLGPVGLAIDLLTAHVPKQQQQEEEEGGADA